jgi:uncharacterized damage-inducible protein DinB
MEALPDICARLRSTPARLETMVHGCSSVILIHKPEGKWSAQEHAGHMADLEPLWLARLRDFTAGNHEMTLADLQNRATDQANHNAQAPEEILRQFSNSRQGLMQSVAAANALAFNWTIPHPRLRTPMRLVDHLFFVAEHDDHHLSTIRELIGTDRTIDTE